MKHWLHHLRDLQANLDAAGAVMVTVANVRGSAPRETGAKMFVSRRGCEGKRRRNDETERVS